MARGSRTGGDVITEALSPRPSPSCASIEELARLRDGGDPRVSRHVAECVRCRAELALLDEFERAAPRPEEEGDTRWIAEELERDMARRVEAAAEAPSARAAQRARRRWFSHGALRPAAAALAIAAAALLVLDLRGQHARHPALSPDASAGKAVLRSDAIALLAPAGELDAPAAELRWAPVPGAASYAVSITEVDRTPVWQAESSRAEATLPADVRARMVPGKPFLWRVVAKDRSGRAVAASPVQRFRVRLHQTTPSQ